MIGKQPVGGWTKHSPAGGVTIGGKFFGGGKFIPSDDYERATPAEKAELERKEKLSETLGPEAAKAAGEQEEAVRSAAQVEEKKFLEDNAPMQVVYVIDDGELNGEKGDYGDLILRNNPYPEPTILPEDLKLLAALKTKQFDIINAETQKVYSLTNVHAFWPQLKLDNNYKALVDTETVDMEEIAIKDYKTLNSVNDELRAALNPLGQGSAPTFNVEPPPGAVQMSLRKKVYYYQNENKAPRVIRLCSCEEAKDSVVTNKIYKHFNVPVIDQNEVPGGVESEFKESEEGDISGVKKHAYLDILLRNLKHELDNIIIVNGQATRSNFDTNLQGLDEDTQGDKELLTKFNPTYDGLTDTELKEQAETFKITPELIDKILSEAEYPKKHCAKIKAVLLKRAMHVV